VRRDESAEHALWENSEGKWNIAAEQRRNWLASALSAGGIGKAPRASASPRGFWRGEGFRKPGMGKGELGLGNSSRPTAKEGREATDVGFRGRKKEGKRSRTSLLAKALYPPPPVQAGLSNGKKKYCD